MLLLERQRPRVEPVGWSPLTGILMLIYLYSKFPDYISMFRIYYLCKQVRNVAVVNPQSCLEGQLPEPQRFYVPTPSCTHWMAMCKSDSERLCRVVLTVGRDFLR